MTCNYPLTEQIKCVQREIDMRNRVYPRLVINGKMTQGQADKELNLMKAVYQTLSIVQQKHLLQQFNWGSTCHSGGDTPQDVTHPANEVSKQS